jgi:tryptophanyl-tRNA synthetase
MKESEYKVHVFTGIRPSGGLTIANVIGSVNTIVSLQKEKKIERPIVFVADLHAITDAKPQDTQKYVVDIIKDYFALGFNKNIVMCLYNLILLRNFELNHTFKD